MELPMYVWTPQTNIRQPKRRPLGEVLRENLVQLLGDAWQNPTGVSASR